LARSNLHVAKICIYSNHLQLFPLAPVRLRPAAQPILGQKPTFACEIAIIHNPRQLKKREQ
ncbi:MAG: hypothetical protein KJN99_06635, partial [Marinicaulis sp.]|nr:hypothetical protein [Marinicaulis sp.]